MNPILLQWIHTFERRIGDDEQLLSLKETLDRINPELAEAMKSCIGSRRGDSHTGETCSECRSASRTPTT